MLVLGRLLVLSVSLSLTVVLGSTSVGDFKCSQPKVSKIQLSIDSRRNETGHWISQYELQRGGNMKNTNLLKMNFEHKTAMCENEETIVIKATVTVPPPKAGPGYELFPGVGYYKFHADTATWQRAREICAEEGGHLAMTNSEKEANVFKLLFARYPKINNTIDSHHAWLGFCEHGVHGEYYTLYGEPLNTAEFMRWSPGEPNQPATYDCLLVNRHSGGFADAPLSWIVPFICEQEL